MIVLGFFFSCSVEERLWSDIEMRPHKQYGDMIRLFSISAGRNLYPPLHIEVNYPFDVQLQALFTGKLTNTLKIFCLFRQIY